MSAFRPGWMVPMSSPNPSTPGAPPGGHVENLASREPASVVELLDPRDHGCDPHRFEHVEVVGAGAGVGADADPNARVEQRARCRQAVPEPRVGARVVGDRRARVREPAHVVAVEPHCVRGGEARAEQADRIEPGGLGLAVEPHPGEGLNLRLRQMGMEAHPVLRGRAIRGTQERFAAMMGNGGREREPHSVVSEGPGRARPLPGRHAGLEGFERDRFRLAPQGRRERVQEARNRPVERAIGHHRGHHRAHSRIGVGLANRLQSFGGRGRELEAEVVGGRYIPCAPSPPPR